MFAMFVEGTFDFFTLFPLRFQNNVIPLHPYLRKELSADSCYSKPDKFNTYKNAQWFFMLYSVSMITVSLCKALSGPRVRDAEYAHLFIYSF